MDRLKVLEDELKSAHPAIRIQSVQMDVQDSKMIKSVIDGLPSQFKDIDVLVNNAGLVIGFDSIENVSDEAIDTMINTNVKGLLHVTKHILPIMRKRNQGHVINISSISGNFTTPFS